MENFFNLRTVKWYNGSVVMIDQTKLPEKLTFVSYTKPTDIALAIKNMVVRGAPAIGVAAAMGLALAAYRSKAKTKGALIRDIELASIRLRSTRPTAVNLMWALSKILETTKQSQADLKTLKKTIIANAIQIAEDDIQANLRIGKYGASLIDDGDTILTHCNAGALATVGYGTALAPIRTSIKQGKKINVIATETRPRLQGARLTSFELSRDGIPVRVITDGMVGFVMSKGLVKKVIVGADRIVSNGIFNKIGTYTIAIAANYHKIPFYVAAPMSTFDTSNVGENVIIEERNPREVTHISNVRVVPKRVNVMNPSFDFTPLSLVDAIISDRGILTHLTKENIMKFVW